MAEEKKLEEPRRALLIGVQIRQPATPGAFPATRLASHYWTNQSLIIKKKRLKKRLMESKAERVKR